MMRPESKTSEKLSTDQNDGFEIVILIFGLSIVSVFVGALLAYATSPIG